MSSYTIYFTSTASTAVTVEADDFETAVELAYEELPGSVCAQCAGWGGRPGIDLSDDWEPNEKSCDVDGKFVEVTA